MPVRETIPIVRQAEMHLHKTAIKAGGSCFSYQQLMDVSGQVAACLLDRATDLAESRVAFMLPPGFGYVATQWGIWRAGGIAVPLCLRHPAPELAYVIDDAQVSTVVAHEEFASLLQPIVQRGRSLRLITPPEALAVHSGTLPRIDASRRAMILYTSGTTARPKGVVTSHENIAAQITNLVEFWEWQPDDHILLALPLHHIHGIVNVLCCAMWSGATCHMLPKFDADAVWQHLCQDELTMFMAVPTIYARLIAAWRRASPEKQRAMNQSCRKLRLMVSGSAALPVSTLHTWREISGHTLLERYGMTEIGMALSNSLHGQRKPGHVGSPLPGVEVRLVDENAQPVADGDPGEIQIRGQTVFYEYWNRPEAKREAFVDGWFKTGDVAVRHDGIYRILGRSSVDILKTGGEKVSALEIEDVLCTHEAIDQCAVVGLSDPHWGQRVGAAIVLNENKNLDLDTLRKWGKQRLADYKVPSRLVVVNELPRNTMGKVTKSEVVELFKKRG